MDSEVEKVIDTLISFRKNKNISIVQLSADSGISRSHLYYIETKKTIPNIETLSKIAHAMDLELKDFFI
ncbi:MAG: helix-turn-helix transcriptional regulator [Treponema sp.]|nr:helix-turn-helix transcriptional regulator [Candidatus Treponema merdequi]MBQ0163541.1 helix-turn-helix transcriptional regulator [Candidatus Treponema scatequi]